MIMFNSIVAAALLSVSPAPQSTDRSGWWMKRMAEKRKLVEAGGSQVVFLGGSAVHLFEMGGSGMGGTIWNRYWKDEPYRALNLGFSGDRTEHVLWRITEGRQLDGYAAKVVVLMLGSDNVAQRGFGSETPIDTIAGFKAILKAISERQPGAVTLLCAIPPRGEKADNPHRAFNATVNRELQKYADGRKVVWLDFGDQLLLPNGDIHPDIMPDFQSPREEGYMIWTGAVLPYVNAIFNGDGRPLASLYPRRIDPLAHRAGGLMSVRPVARIRQKSWRGEDWWGDRMVRNRRIICERNRKIDFVFAGDSITHFWEDYGGREYAALTNRYSILNIGYGGDQTQDLLWRLENGELDGYRAKGVMLMIGTNNNGIGGYDPAHTAEGIRACLDVIRRKQPQAKIVLMAILPRAVGVADGDPAKDNGADARNRRTNELLRGFADGKNVVFVDIGDKFLVGGKIPKELMFDRIHPTEKGYAIWREAIAPILKEATGK
jgi:lysophospholipase L1-like esterase